MKTRLLNPKPKGNKNWMKGFIIPKPKEDIDHVETDRIRTFTRRRKP